MNIDWQIVQALALITGIFFILGAPLKWKMPQLPFFCLPGIGMVVFASPAKKNQVIKKLSKHLKVHELGRVVEGNGIKLKAPKPIKYRNGNP